VSPRMASSGATGGRVAIITGAGSGIGAATAEELARAGMRLAIAGRRPGPIETVLETVSRLGVDAFAMSTDVREYAQVEALVCRTLERFGRVDAYVANAAIADFGPIHLADPTVWADVITTNVLGVMFGVRAVLPHLLQQGWGHIVVMNSTSGRSTYVGEPAYCASKHAALAFADCLRLEVAERGIRVSVVEPGSVETPLLRRDPGVEQYLVGITPLAAADCARAVRYVLEQPANCNVFEVMLRPTREV
jgi:clavulanate-9-aldehyde reducatase